MLRRLANVSADESKDSSSTVSLFYVVGLFKAKLLAPIDVRELGTKGTPVLAGRKKNASLDPHLVVNASH
jgi:hypothetical protein